MGWEVVVTTHSRPEGMVSSSVGNQQQATTHRTGWLHSRPLLLLAFAFAVMADPVSSVAYAMQAALRALHADLSPLVPTMCLVVGLITLVILNYHQLVARYRRGGRGRGGLR